jgi:RNA polymerase sigma-70 factor (ECF subfamily)
VIRDDADARELQLFDTPREFDMAEPPLLDQYRPYLRVLARIHLAGSLQARLDASDIVQQTMLQAHQAIQSFRGSTDAEMSAWLRQILAHNLNHALRDHQRGKRDIRREQSLEAQLHRSSARMLDLLSNGERRPEARVEQREALLQLATALEDIGEDQRTAIELHYLQELPVSEVAERMDRSVSAVGGLLHRGLKSLRRQLAAEP